MFIGDSGEKDIDIYCVVVVVYLGWIKVIYIWDVCSSGCVEWV